MSIFIFHKKLKLNFTDLGLKYLTFISKFRNNDSFVVSINKNSKIEAGTKKISNSDLQDIEDWIILNYDLLIKFWNTNSYEEAQKIIKQLKKL